MGGTVASYLHVPAQPGDELRFASRSLGYDNICQVNVLYAMTIIQCENG